MAPKLGHWVVVQGFLRRSLVRSRKIADPVKSTTHAFHVPAIFPNKKDFIINYLATMKIAVFATLLATASAFSINKADFAKVRFRRRLKTKIRGGCSIWIPLISLWIWLTLLAKRIFVGSSRGLTNFCLHVAVDIFLGCRGWSRRLWTCPATR